MDRSDARHRIIVTGASGFAGRHLTARLRERLGNCGTVWPLFEAVGDDERRGDIVDGAAVASRIAALKPTAVVHLAAIAAPMEAGRDRRRAFDVNLIGTLNVAKAILEHAPEARLLFAGSSESYGASFNRDVLPLGEAARLLPMSTYGATKAAAELVIAQMRHEGLRAVSLRPFNHTGPGQSRDYVVPAFCAQIAAIEAGLQPPVLKVGNLDAARDFLDVRDVVDLYASAALAPPDARLPDALNVSTGTPVAISALLERLLALSDRTIAVEEDPSRMRPSIIPVASGNPASAMAALGWQPLIPLDRTLAETLDHARRLCSA